MNVSFIPAIGERFCSLMKTVTLLKSFLLLAETVTAMIGNQSTEDRTCSCWWNLIFWLVETILFQYFKYAFHLKQFFHLLEVYFKRILHYSQWQRIFFLFLLEETVFFNFFQILFRMEVSFWPSEITFFKKSFILASGNGCLINYKLCAFVWSFFLLVNAILEIRRKVIFFDLFYS